MYLYKILHIRTHTRCENHLHGLCLIASNVSYSKLEHFCKDFENLVLTQDVFPWIKAFLQLINVCSTVSLPLQRGKDRSSIVPHFTRFAFEC